MQLRMHAKAGNKRQLTWSAGDALFSVLRCLRSSGVLLCCLPLSPFFSLFSSLLFPFFSVLLSFSWKLALRRTDEDDRCWSFCAQPMVAASRDSETDRPRRFWSLFVFSPSADAFSRDDEDDGDEGVLCWWSCRPCLCVFPCFRQYPSYVFLCPASLSFLLVFLFSFFSVLSFLFLFFCSPFCFFPPPFRSAAEASI